VSTAALAQTYALPHSNLAEDASMSSLDHFPAPLDADMEKQRAELAAIIRRNTAEDGSYATAVGSLFMSRHSQNHDFAPVLAQPALCIMAQGRKEVRLADEFFNYDPLNYLVVSVSMPLSGRVVNVRRRNRSSHCGWTSTRRKSPP
jgi:hypothetical protein